MKFTSRILAGALVLVTTTGLSMGQARAANVAFIHDGVVLDDRLGYAAGQTVHFVFVLNDYKPATLRVRSQNSPGAGAIAWDQDFATQPHLWSAVLGTGLTGGWNMAEAESSNLTLHVMQNPPPGSSETLNITGQNDALVPTNNSGLFANGFEVSYFQSQNVWKSLEATNSGLPIFFVPAPDPTDLFSRLLGEYFRDPIFSTFARFDALGTRGTESMNYRIDKLTIALGNVVNGQFVPAPVPLPATLPLLLAAIGITSRLVRNRRTR